MVQPSPQPFADSPHPAAVIIIPSLAMSTDRGWQEDVYRGLYGLLEDRAPLLRPRAARWGASTELAAHLGSLACADGTQVTHGTDARTVLERRAQAGLLAHFQGHLHCIRGGKGPSTISNRLELYFLETPAAEEAQLRACNDQIFTLPAEGSHCTSLSA